jgi:hypothetical protein
MAGTYWSSYWNRETRERHKDPDWLDGDVDSEDRGDIWVRYGGGKISRGDTVYCIGVENGTLMLFGGLVVGRLSPDSENPLDLNLWFASGTEVEFLYDHCEVSDEVADQIVYLREGDMSEHHIARDGRGRLLATAFQGPNSVRRLVRGHRLLDTELRER